MTLDSELAKIGLHAAGLRISGDYERATKIEEDINSFRWLDSVAREFGWCLKPVRKR